MPRELVTVQVGQCGNQIGCRFWELALREHAAHNAKGVYDEAISSFFRNVDSTVEPPRMLPVGDGRGLIRGLKARSVIGKAYCIAALQLSSLLLVVLPGSSNTAPDVHNDRQAVRVLPHAARSWGS
jgi:hypothetical protein